jgi:hypothetical protein
MKRANPVAFICDGGGRTAQVSAIAQMLNLTSLSFVLYASPHHDYLSEAKLREEVPGEKTFHFIRNPMMLNVGFRERCRLFAGGIVDAFNSCSATIRLHRTGHVLCARCSCLPDSGASGAFSSSPTRASKNLCERTSLGSAWQTASTCCTNRWRMPARRARGARDMIFDHRDVRVRASD